MTNPTKPGLLSKSSRHNNEKSSPAVVVHHYYSIMQQEKSTARRTRDVLRRGNENSQSSTVSFRNGDSLDVIDSLTHGFPAAGGEGRPSLLSTRRGVHDSDFVGFDFESFRNLDDAIAQAVRNSLRDVQTEHAASLDAASIRDLQSAGSTRYDGDSCFESFRNLDHAINHAMQNSLNDMGGGPQAGTTPCNMECMGQLLENVAIDRAMQLQELKEHGCSSFESLRDLKRAMQASMQVLDDLLQEEAVDDILREEQHDKGVKARTKYSGMTFITNDNTPWREYGCSSLESYRDLKQAMESSMQGRDEKEGSDTLHAIVAGGRGSSFNENVPHTGPVMNSEEQNEEETPRKRLPSRRRMIQDNTKNQSQRCLHASFSAISTFPAQDLKHSLHTSMKAMQGGLSDSFRESLAALNGNLDEAEAFQKALRLSAEEEIDYLRVQQDSDILVGWRSSVSVEMNDEEEMSDEVVKEAYNRNCSENVDSPTLHGDDKVEENETSCHRERCRTTIKIATMLESLRRNRDSLQDDIAEHNDEGYTEKAQLKKLSNLHGSSAADPTDEDPILLMESLTTSKREKKKKNTNDLSNKNRKRKTQLTRIAIDDNGDLKNESTKDNIGKSSAPNERSLEIDEVHTTRGVEKKASLDERIAHKKKSSYPDDENAKDFERKKNTLTFDERILLKNMKEKPKNEPEGRVRRSSSSSIGNDQLVNCCASLKKSYSSSTISTNLENDKNLPPQEKCDDRQKEADNKNSLGLHNSGVHRKKHAAKKLQRLNSLDDDPNINDKVITQKKREKKSNQIVEPNERRSQESAVAVSSPPEVTSHDIRFGPNDMLEDDPLKIIDRLMDDKKKRGKDRGGGERGLKCRTALAVKKLFSL